MMQNSLERLFGGMIDSLRDVVLPDTDDVYARAQLSACIEILANLSTRVEWRRSHLDDTASRAQTALEAAAAAAPELERFARPPSAAIDPLAARDDALRRVSDALRACADLASGDAARATLLDFSRWHVATELNLLRTGMFGR